MADRSRLSLIGLAVVALTGCAASPDPAADVVIAAPYALATMAPEVVAAASPMMAEARNLPGAPAVGLRIVVGESEEQDGTRLWVYALSPENLDQAPALIDALVAQWLELNPGWVRKALPVAGHDVVTLDIPGATGLGIVSLIQLGDSIYQLSTNASEPVVRALIQASERVSQ
jgi:hypothetical protein